MYNVKVLYTQADMGFAAEAGLFLAGGKDAFCPQKGCNAPSAGYKFPRKIGIFLGGGGKGVFRPIKGCNAPSAGYRFPRNIFFG